MVDIGQSQASAPAFPEVTFLPSPGAEAWVDVVDIPDLRQRDLDPPIWKAHRIDFHLLAIVTGGTGRHMVDFEHYSVNEGCVLHIAPKQVHQFERDGSFEGKMVLFVPNRMEDLMPRFTWPAVACLPAPDFALLESLVRSMEEVGSEHVQASANRVRPKLLVALLEIARSAIRRSDDGHQPSSDPEREAFESLVENHFATHRELSWYAQELKTSVRTLTRRSRKHWNKGAKWYIDRRVALEAKRLLVHTDLAIEAVGYRLGFSEATNFVKFFKRCEGTTPAGFRNVYK